MSSSLPVVDDAAGRNLSISTAIAADIDGDGKTDLFSGHSALLNRGRDSYTRESIRIDHESGAFNLDGDFDLDGDGRAEILGSSESDIFAIDVDLGPPAKTTELAKVRVADPFVDPRALDWNRDGIIDC